MKKNGFRKLNFLIAIGGIFVALALGSCENLLSSASSSDDSAPVNFFPPVGNVENGYGIVHGILPQETSASTRSAMPDVPTIFSYQVFAQNGTTIIQANVDNASKTFSISLPYGTWNITANGLLANGRVIFTKTQRIVVSEPELNVPPFKLEYSLNPDDGEGTISLTVTFPDATSTITGIEYTLTKGGNSKTVAVDSADVAAGTFTIERTTEDLGTYNLTIKCYGDFNNLVYRIDEIVNVYANLTTDKFVGSAPYISGGDIVITQAMLDEFQQATLYVNATIGNDSNNGTQFDPLRTFNRAVELVNNSTRSADTEFRIFLQSDVVDGAKLELKAGKKLTVANAGNTIHTITSLNGTFTVAATSTLIAQSMQFQKLRFVVDGTFEMNGGTISGNEVDDNGGAIYIKAGGQATISNGTTISGNTTSLNGGGVYVDSGTFTMTGGKISDNTATGAGGAIYIKAGGQATISNGTTISGNTATGGNGGGIFNIGTLAITDSTISNCTARNAGSGIYNSTISASASITNCTISGTSSTYGGGIYVGGGTLSLDGCTIGGDSESDGCTAENGGGINIDGGTLTFTGSTTTIKNCTATTFGGGIYINTSAAITNCSIESCKITATSGTVGGGGIYNAGGTASDPVTITGCTIKQCTSETSGNGGGIYNTKVLAVNGGEISDCKSKSGGGIYVSTGTLTMDGGTISDNIANESGGGVYVYNGTFTMNDGTISGNISRGTTEGSFGGGGIYIYRSTASASGGVFTMTGGTVSGNEAVYGGGIWGSNFSEISLEGGTFSGNTATTSGQGAYVSPGCTFKMSGAASLVSNNGDNDVYLHGVKNSSTGAVMSYATITVAGALTATSPVATITSAIYEADQAVLSADTGLTITPTICSSFALSSAPAGMAELGITPDGTGTKGILKQSLLYVRGSGAGWYAENPAYIASAGNDANLGSKTAPFATIQKAIETAFAMNDGVSEYTIWVDGTITGGTTATANGMGDISPTKALNLKIQSMSATTNATLDAESSGRVLNINANAAVTLKNLNIANGNAADNGGGIYNSGTLTMEGGTISACVAGSYGGGIYNDGTFNFERGIIGGVTSVEANTAPRGGGVYNSGTLTSNGTITGNTAGTDGGGVYNYNTFIMNSGTISGNTATYGGGVHNSGTFTIKGGTISYNRATGLNDSGGGGIHLYNGSVTMEGGTISGNEATGTTDDSGGGGIYIYTGKTFTMSGGTFSENKAIKGNGAFVAKSGTLNMSGAANFASDDDVYLYDKTGASGVSPTICVAGALTATSPVATITPSAYAVGTQVLSAGAGITITSDICNQFDLSPDPAGTEWIIAHNGDNTRGVLYDFDLYVSQIGSDTTGDGTQTAPFATMQKAIDTIESFGKTESDFTIHVSGTVKGNSTINKIIVNKITIKGTTGFATDILDGEKNNRGVLAVFSASVELRDIQITNGTAVNGGGIFLSAGAFLTISDGTKICGNASTYGGGIYTTSYDCKIEMTGGEISGNASVTSGGGIYLSGRGTFTMSGGTITGNTAAEGGGVYASGGILEMSGDAKISGNEASPGTGGGIYLGDSATFTMTGGTISGNTATNNGGGVSDERSSFTMTGGEISGNNSDSSAGGVWIWNVNSPFKLAGGKIKGNTARYGGGVTCGSDSTLEFTDGEISGNESTVDAGGIYVNSGGLAMSGGRIFGNKAARYGGGVFAGAPFEMTGGTIGGESDSDANTAQCGGGVYVYTDKTFEMSGTAKIIGCKTTETGSGQGGGGIYSLGNVVAQNVTISDCTSMRSGGGIYVYGGTLTFVGGEISGCTTTSADADTGGGGIYNVAGGTVEIIDARIGSCTAGRTGGGIYNFGTLLVSGTDFVQCKTISNSGGGICNSTGATATVTNCNFTNCEAALQGGGIRNAGTLTISGVTYSGCTATTGGPDIYNVGTITP